MAQVDKNEAPMTATPESLRMLRGITVWLMLLWTPRALATPPDWAADAIWYQIFPERFRNGDAKNDPVPTSLEGTWPYEVPAGWKVSPWTSDWYALQPWEQASGKDFYHNAQLRRYGGDLQGILDRLDYLKDLGVNALYLNPVFDSPSLHKYGAARYHHIDRHFGPDPAGDAALFAAEDPADPATWRWSAADRLFLKLIREAHRRKMRIIIDGVFNHTGTTFWALQQARREGPGSRFARWFHITRWDDPATPTDEFDYRGWSGIKDLPEIQRDAENLHPEVRQHFHSIVRRWMDPNGDGNPEEGIDGWRVDVAAEVPMGFWKEFRGWVHTLNPQAYITGEIWWEDYSANTFRNARPWLDQAFDGVMNYRFGDAVFQFLNQPRSITPAQFAEALELQHRHYGYDRCLALQNLLGSHDTSRVGSAVVNPSARQDHGASLKEDRGYDPRAPNAAEKARWRQMIALQFLSPGAPYLYYGDEVGMWGADDPDCRKPMVWADLHYTPEKRLPSGHERPADAVTVDTAQAKYYRDWIQRRHAHPALRRGDYRTLPLEQRFGLLAFERRWQEDRIIALFNPRDTPVRISPQDLGLQDLRLWKQEPPHPADSTAIEVPAHQYRILTHR